MLVLSRKVGESIQISDNIFVKVIEVKGGRVRLSFDAPKEIQILREELSVEASKAKPTTHFTASDGPSQRRRNAVHQLSR